ncbi:hypothetical protein ACQEWB_22380 [Streptomyces sp. CA-249302]|uniref:hypothetical protein n=1 Tax=Streptomyces sp. CA-249302 TaxID=3240058 RepID=UPI003D8CBE69
MASIGTRVVGLGNHHTSRTEAGTILDVDREIAEFADESPHVQVAWDSGHTSWVPGDGVKRESEA